MNEFERPDLYNVDCMIALKEFPDKFFDLAIVDPPYGIGIFSMNYTKSGAVRVHGKNVATRNDYRRLSDWDIKPGKEYFDELFRVSKKQIIWGGELFRGYTPAVERVHNLGQKVRQQYDERFRRLRIRLDIVRAWRRPGL